MSKLTVIISLVFLTLGCKAQNKHGNAPDQQDIDTTPPIYYGMPTVIAAVDTSAGWTQDGRRILLTGTVYQRDGKTPAPGIIIYYYHTNTAGEYVHLEEEAGSLPLNNMGLTHGYIRGWIQTDENGKYSLYTVRPGSYPSRGEPEHIHLNIKEPDAEEHYYIDDLVFDDDQLLTSERREKLANRGGSGVVRLLPGEELQIGKRDIILGLNVPNPKRR